MVGGFEVVLQRVVRWLQVQGHDVRVLSVRADLTLDAVLGRAPSRSLERAAPGFLSHLALVAAFRRMDLTSADLVLSSQPPSQAVRHRRHLSLFYHHDRAYYDLADLMTEAGYVPDPPLHQELAAIVRGVDQPGFEAVSRFLVPSTTVRKRLERYNDISGALALPFHAGPGLVFDSSEGEVQGGHDRAAPSVLCVGRHEFPKRSELFVQAAHLVPEATFVSVGSGSRLDYVRQVDELLATSSPVDPRALWCRPHFLAPPLDGTPGEGAVQFEGNTQASRLRELYRGARCVVAPALDEDYGLTALEAMAHGSPLVVCEDGGSLAELVQSTGAGFVVPPEPGAIAEAVRRVIGDAELSRSFRSAGRRAITERFTWLNSMAQLTEGIHQVAAS